MWFRSKLENLYFTFGEYLLSRNLVSKQKLITLLVEKWDAILDMNSSTDDIIYTILGINSFDINKPTKGFYCSPNTFTARCFINTANYLNNILCLSQEIIKDTLISSNPGEGLLSEDRLNFLEINPLLFFSKKINESLKLNHNLQWYNYLVENQFKKKTTLDSAKFDIINFQSNKMPYKIFDIISKSKVLNCYPSKIVCAKTTLVNQIGIPLHKAHRVWTEIGLKKADTLYGLSRQSENFTTNDKLLRVELEFVDEIGRYYFGFKGYFVSILISFRLLEILDTRACRAR